MKRGYADRHQGATDRRRITGSITTGGGSILKTLEAGRDASFSTIFETFSNEELTVLLKLINRWSSITESS